MPGTAVQKPSPRDNLIIRNALITEDRYGFDSFPQIPGNLAHEMVWHRTKSHPLGTRRIPDATPLKNSRKKVFTEGISAESRLREPTFLLEKKVVIPSNLPNEVKFFRYKEMISLDVNSGKTRKTAIRNTSDVDTLLNLHPVLPAIGYFARDGIPSGISIPRMLPAPTSLDTNSILAPSRGVDATSQGVPDPVTEENNENGDAKEETAEENAFVDNEAVTEKTFDARVYGTDAPETNEDETNKPDDADIADANKIDDAAGVDSAQNKDEADDATTAAETIDPPKESDEQNKESDESKEKPEESMENKSDEKDPQPTEGNPTEGTGDTTGDADKTFGDDPIKDPAENTDGDSAPAEEKAVEDGEKKAGTENADGDTVPAEEKAIVDGEKKEGTPERPSTSVPQNSPRNSITGGNQKGNVNILNLDSPRKKPEVHTINLAIDVSQCYEVKCKQDLKSMYPMYDYKKSNEDKLQQVSFDESSLKTKKDAMDKIKKPKAQAIEDGFDNKGPGLDVPSSPNREKEYRRKFRRARKKKPKTEIVIIPRDYICADDIVVHKPINENAQLPENLFGEYLTVLKANIKKDNSDIPGAPPGSRLAHDRDIIEEES